MVSIAELELKTTGAIISPQTVSARGPVLEQFVTQRKTLRFVGWMSRFIQYLKGKVTRQEPRTGSLTVSKVEVSQKLLWKWVQWQHYPIETHVLPEGKALPSGSPLLMLNLFLDKDGLN